MTDNHHPSSSSSPAPSTSSTLVSASPNATWHAIRPWIPPLTLSIREVTSVSATFLLSTTVSQSSDNDLDLDLVHDLEHEEHTQQHDPSSIISKTLAKGLSVNVNGSPWQRFFVRIDDPTDEATIIVFGLMPGRQYDIDLGIMHTRNIQRQLTTDGPDSEPPLSPPSSAPSAGVPLANDATMATASTTSGGTSDPALNPPAPPPFTVEDRLAQLNQTLSLLSTERDAVQAQIKAVRRDSQKADAAIRSEIEALKRASEKHLAAEARAKQKILALQEAVKQAQAGARASEEKLIELEGSLPALLKEEQQKEAEYQRVKKIAERVRSEKEAAEERDRKRLEKLRAELVTLSNKLEKLRGKQERVEKNVIPDLEEQLKQTRKGLEDLKKEEEALAIEELSSMSRFGAIGREYPLQGFSRRRANTGGAAPNPGPISRPQRVSDTSFTPTSVGQHESLQMQHVLLPQQRRDSLKANNGYFNLSGPNYFNYGEQLQAMVPPSPSSSSGSPVGLHTSSVFKHPSSTLSSRAHAFEPLRHPSYTIPIQRPSGATVTRSKSGASAHARHA